ncbi:DUF4153 domain-containing protein [Streptomyces sp. SYSU K217416]
MTESSSTSPAGAAPGDEPQDAVPTPRPEPTPGRGRGPGPEPAAGPGAEPAAAGPAAGPASQPPSAADPYRPRQQAVWQPPRTESPEWLAAVSAADPAAIRPATLWSVLATALLSALLLGDGLGLSIVLVAVPAALAAFFAAQAAGRRLRPWTAVWAFGGVALLSVPALRDAGWPVFLAVVSALALGSLALHGSRSWLGVLIGPLGILGSLGSGMGWAWQGLRDRAAGSKDRWGPVVRTTLVAVVLLVVFGALFAGADAAFAGLLGGLVPDVSVADGPWRFFLFLLGLLGALAAAHTAAAPLRWDRIEVKPGRARGRMEWALPLIVLNVLFAAFIAVQLTVLFGGYDKVLSQTGLTYAEYARQGFWQLLWATLLTLAVIAGALRWAPRGRPRDRTLVRSVLGVLCLLTLVVVVSALRRMDLYVDEYGLTRLRVSVAAMEMWLGLVIVLIMAAGARGGAAGRPLGARWLPRAVAASGAAAVLAFGLVSPDALVADQNVARYERLVAGRAGGQEGTPQGTSDTRPDTADGREATEDGELIDLAYLQSLSADAAPALDKLPEPLRSCALRGINDALAASGDEPWYATSLGEYRARVILNERPLKADWETCRELGTFGDSTDGYGY